MRRDAADRFDHSSSDIMYSLLLLRYPHCQPPEKREGRGSMKSFALLLLLLL